MSDANALTKGELEQRIEAQLMTAGGFYPIEWLIDNGYLAYDVYEAWRLEKVDMLDDDLRVSLKQVKQDLEVGIQYVEKRKLISEQETYLSWGASQKPLKASTDSTLNTYLTHRWIRQEEQLPQMDLFMDNPVVVIENAICDALVSKNWDSAQQQINKLYQQDSGNKFLNHYDNLLAYCKHASEPVECDLDVIYEETDGLETSIAPLAAEALKTRARDFLAPAWRRIVTGLMAFPLQANGHEKLHPSYAQSQIPLWQNVIDSITATEDFFEDSYLLQRYATAQLHTQQRHAHVLSWVLLFWLFDEEAAAIILDSPAQNLDSTLLYQWQRYEDRDIDEPASLFACWLMLHDPHSLRAVKGHPIALLFEQDSELTDLYHLLLARLNNEEELDLRAKLQQSNPVLLQMYLQKMV